jgi:hypothetical protein
MYAVWMIRSRQLSTRMRFWTSIVGYDPLDRSLSHRIYLIYVIIFFSLWWFAMLALIADWVVRLFSLFKGLSPVQVAIILIVFILLADVFLRSYRYARQSPFLFSGEDAVLICQTPVDRRLVALAWLYGDWLPAGLPYWAGAVTLSFACQQMATPTGMNWSDLPIYILAGLRTASIVLPLHLAFMTFTYIFGALRLRRDKDLIHLRQIPIVLGAGIILLAKFFPTTLLILLKPIFYFLEAGFGEASWVLSFVLVVILVVLNILILYLVSTRLNLSRASQESYLSWDLR